jgi:hypothetical protein
MSRGKKPLASGMVADKSLTDAELRAFEEFVRETGAEIRKFEEVLHLTDAEPRELGKVFRQFARGLSADLRQILKAAGFANVDHVFTLADALEETRARPQLDKICVPVPVTMIASAAAILSSLPGAQRGRPRDFSTDEAVKLAAEIKSVRAAAKLVAAHTGKSEEAVRSNIRSAMKRSKNRSTGTRSRSKKGRV